MEEGICWVEKLVELPGKIHNHDTGLFVERSVKSTQVLSQKAESDTENAATGAGTALLAVIRNSSIAKPGSPALNVTSFTNRKPNRIVACPAKAADETVCVVHTG